METSFFVYCLYSFDHDRLYIGLTNNITRRLREHNLGNNKSTKAYMPWTLIFQEIYSSRKEARDREVELKLTHGRRYLRTLIPSSGFK